MNNYNIILEYIDEINDSVVTTESNVIKTKRIDICGGFMSKQMNVCDRVSSIRR